MQPITLIFLCVPCALLFHLSSKVKVLQTEDCLVVYLHTITTIQSTQRDAVFSADSPQEFLVSSCHYVLVKEVAKLWKNGSSAPHGHPFAQCRPSLRRASPNPKY